MSIVLHGVLPGTNSCASYADSFSGIIIPINGVWFLDANYFNWSLFPDNGDECNFICKEWGFSALPAGAIITAVRVTFNQCLAAIADDMNTDLNVGYNVDPAFGVIGNSLTGDIGPLTFGFQDTYKDVSVTYPITAPQSALIIPKLTLASFGFSLLLHGNFDNDLQVDQITFDLLYDPPTVPYWSQKSYRLNRNRPFIKVR